MRNTFLKFLMLCTLAGTVACHHVRAQFIGTTSPQTESQEVLNAVSGPVVGPAWDVTKTTCTPPSGGACGIQNLGQNFHTLTYVSTSPAAQFQLRLEASIDGDNYFPLTDDATSQTSGVLYGQGYYPVVRVNLLAYSGSGTITAFYAGTSTGSVPPTGSMNQSQTYKKILASAVAGGSTATYSLNPPCASTGGLIWFQYNAGALGGAAFSVYSGSDLLNLFTTPFLYTIANNSNVQSFPVPAQPGTFIQVTLSGTTGSTYSMQYDFNCPGGQGGYGLGAPQVAGLLQPDSAGTATNNTETTSATATSIVKTITGVAGERVSLFSVNARCSAGTSSLTIADNATQIWSTAATEVGTTTFKFQWSPGLAAKLGDGMTITLASCGSGNTGTLDVQASVN
jgi:hypothetical protein